MVANFTYFTCFKLYSSRDKTVNHIISERNKQVQKKNLEDWRGGDQVRIVQEIKI